MIYQLPLYELKCCTLLDKRYLSHSMCLYQVIMTLHFLNDVANGAESTQTSKIMPLIANLKSETMGKLIKRIPGSCLLISSFPGSALRRLVELLGKPRDVNKRSQSLIKTLTKYSLFAMCLCASSCEFGTHCICGSEGSDETAQISCLIRAYATHT